MALKLLQSLVSYSHNSGSTFHLPWLATQGPHCLSEGREKFRTSGVHNSPLPSGESDIAVCQKKEGEAESGMNRVDRASTWPGMPEVLQFLERNKEIQVSRVGPIAAAAVARSGTSALV